MRKSVKSFVNICAKILPCMEPIYEIGSLQVPGQVGFSDLRPLFPNKKFVGTDMREGPGVDQVVNIHKTNLPDHSVGTLLMLDTIEHVEYCRQAMDEAYRILKPDGILIMSSVMNYPIHAYPNDYWRFTPEAFKSLLQNFNKCVVESSGDSIFPHTVVGIGFKNEVDEAIINTLVIELTKWRQQWRFPIFSKEQLKILVPPLFFILYRSFCGKKT